VPAQAQPARVARIVDGDTIWVEITESDGPLPAGADHNIRLLEYDSPEDTTITECGGPEATAALDELIPAGSRVFLESDQQGTDQYGRFLRYVHTADGTFVNLDMVRQGHGEAVLYEPNDAHIDEMRGAEQQARSADRGIWGPPCNADAEPEPEPESEPSCDPSYCDPFYPDVCIAPPPPDLNCDDIAHEDFRVEGNDPHGFDGDNDGVGCET